MITSFANILRLVNSVMVAGDKIEEGHLGQHMDTQAGRELILTEGSITRLLAKFIIEPKIVVSRNLMNHEQVEKAIELNVDLFAALYSRAFTVLANVNNLDISSTLELLSSSSMLQGHGRNLGLESYDALKLALESDSGILPLTDESVVSMEKINTAVGKGTKITSRTSGINNKSVDLDKGSLGKMIMRDMVITLKVDGVKKSGVIKKANGDMETKVSDVSSTIEIPLLLKASIIYSGFDNISRMLTVSEDDKRFWNRIDDTRAGIVSKFDLIFAGDMIADYKKKRLKDNDDLIRDMEIRNRTANVKAATSGAIGFNKYYQMILVSGEDKVRIENQLRGKLSKERTKDNFLEQSKSLTLTVLDDDYERMLLFIKDIKSHNNVSYKSLARRGSKDNEVLEILKFVMSSSI